MVERIQKVLARQGVASRRTAEELIRAGRVTVNEQPATLGQTVTEADVIRVNGEVVERQRHDLYYALNKPVGYVTSRRSTHGERTVMELLPANVQPNPVGRLDKDTSGLLLLTSDGDWANLVTHPRYRIDKEYEVVVRGNPSEDALARLRGGIRLRDGSTTAPARIRRLASGETSTTLSVTVIEGRKRQIREMLAAIGNPVTRLRRVRIGSIVLGPLPEGEVRQLQVSEIESIRERARRPAEARPAGEAANRD